jgi:hypothetical protein
MRLIALLPLSWALQATATILENGQERLDPYPGQVSEVSIDPSWRSYDADASEFSYKGRWDSSYTSCKRSDFSCRHQMLTGIARVVVCFK